MTDPACAELKKYTYTEHRFKFAAWAAARATALGAGISLTNRESCEVLKATGFYEMAQKGVEGLPCAQDDATAYDANHCTWCKKVLEEVSKVAQHRGSKNWKHGKAAKLINVFLKALMPANLEGLSDEKKKKWDAVHPPIDSMVLEGMEEHGIGDSAFWNSLPYRWEYNGGDRKKKYEWTKFGYEQYQSVINLIRDNLKNCGETDPLPLWKNERFFNPC